MKKSKLHAKTVSHFWRKLNISNQKQIIVQLNTHRNIFLQGCYTVNSNTALSVTCKPKKPWCIFYLSAPFVALREHYLKDIKPQPIWAVPSRKTISILLNKSKLHRNDVGGIVRSQWVHYFFSVNTVHFSYVIVRKLYFEFSYFSYARSIPYLLPFTCNVAIIVFTALIFFIISVIPFSFIIRYLYIRLTITYYHLVYMAITNLFVFLTKSSILYNEHLKISHSLDTRLEKQIWVC